MDGLAPTIALPRAHPPTRGELARLLAGPLGPEGRDPALFPPSPARHRAHPRRRRDPRLEPPQLPRPVRDRLLPRPPDLLRGKAGAVQESARRLVPQLPRRLPDQARRLRRGVGG